MLWFLNHEYVAMVSRVRLSSSEIETHLQQQANSDLSVSAYCRQHGLKITNFHNWRSNRRRKGELNPGGWVELTGACEPVASLMPEQKTPGSEYSGSVLVELVLPGGIVLRVRPGSVVAG